MLTDKWVFLNGQFLLESHATIPLSDRGFLFGDGVFTTIKVVNGKCEFLTTHLKRLENQAIKIDLKFPFIEIEWIIKLIEKNQAFFGDWRLKILLTAQENNTKREVNTLLMTVEKYEPSINIECELIVFPYPYESIGATIKSLSYLPYLLAKKYAHSNGKNEAILIDSNEYILETNCANLFWIDQNEIWIPDPSLSYLQGVCLHSLLSVISIPINYAKITYKQFPAHAYVYCCNSLRHIQPVISINENKFKRHLEIEKFLKITLEKALAIDEN